MYQQLFLRSSAYYTFIRYKSHKEVDITELSLTNVILMMTLFTLSFK